MSEKEAKPTKHRPGPKPGDCINYDGLVQLRICCDDPKAVIISGIKGDRRKLRDEVTPLDAVEHLVEQYYLLMQRCASVYLHGLSWEEKGLIPCRREAYADAEEKAEEKLGEIRRAVEQYPTCFFNPGEPINTFDFELPDPFDLDCKNFADWKKEAKRVRFDNTRRRLNIAENIERTKSSGKKAAAQESKPPRMTAEEIEARAMAILLENQNWTLRQIAEEIGCRRETLSRPSLSKFRNFRKDLAAGNVQKYKDGLGRTEKENVDDFLRLKYESD